eukprot:235097-Heterocapsa_arctica.AAC.1
MGLDDECFKEKNELEDRRPGGAAAAEQLAPGGCADSYPSLGAHRRNALRQRRRGGRPRARAVKAAACGRQALLVRSKRLRSADPARPLRRAAALR